LSALRRTLNRRSIAGFLYVPVAAVSGLMSSTAVLANLPADASGLFFLCQGLIPFVLLFDLGLLVIGTREIAFASGREQANGVPSGGVGEVLQTFLRFRDARAVSLMLVLIAALTCGIGMASLSSVRETANVQALAFCAVAAALVLCSYVYQSFLEGTGNYHLDRLASTGTVLLSGLMITAAALWGRTFWLVIIAWYAGQMVTVAVKAFLAHRLNPGVHFRRKIEAQHVVPTVRQSFSLFLIQLGAAVTKYVQYPIITAVLGVASLGTYFFVVRIAGTVDQAISVLNASQRAIFSQHCAAGRRGDARGLMRNVFLQVVALTAVGSAIIIFVLPMLVHLFTNHTGVSAVPFWVIGLDLMSMCISGMMTQFVIASGYNPFAKVVLATGALTLALLSFLVPRYGLLGAALGQFLANALISLSFSSWHFVKLYRSMHDAA
jgi:O-antigen/teichoic acid export membrane protein